MVKIHGLLGHLCSMLQHMQHAARKNAAAGAPQPKAEKCCREAAPASGCSVNQGINSRNTVPEVPPANSSMCITHASNYLNAQVSWAGPLLLHQVLSTCNKICEGVLLVQVLAVLIPAAPHFSPTPHMGQRKHKAPIYEGQSVGTQVWVITYLVRTIPARSKLLAFFVTMLIKGLILFHVR